MAIVTVKAFKDKFQKGQKVSTLLYWAKNGQWELQREWPEREISITNTVGFAFKTWREDEKKHVNSYCNWPRKDDISMEDESTYSIIEKDNQTGKGWCKLIYKLL